MRLSRGGEAKAATTALRSVLDGMTLDEQAAAIRRRLQGRSLNAAGQSAIRQYQAFMAQACVRRLFPVGFTEASGYLSWKAVHKGRLTHALKQHLGHLKRAAQAMGQRRVSEEERQMLKRQIKELQGALPSTSKVTAPTSVDEMRRTVRRLSKEPTLAAAQARALILVPMGTHARGTEVGGDERGMRWGDLQADPRGLGFGAVLPKTDQSTTRPHPRAFPHMPRHLVELCPACCLRTFKERWRAAGGAVGDADYMWCRISTDDSPLTMPLSVGEAMAIAQRAFAEDGVRIGAHWARYAGSNLLTRALLIDREEADVLGNWAPAERRKPRSTREKVYELRDVDDALDLAARVMKGTPTCSKRR